MMCMRERKRIKPRGVHLSIPNRRVGEYFFVVDQRENVRVWIRLQRGEQHLLPAADGWERVEDERDARVRESRNHVILSEAKNLRRCKEVSSARRNTLLEFIQRFPDQICCGLP